MGFKGHLDVFSKTRIKNSAEKPAALRNAQKPPVAHAAFAEALYFLDEADSDVCFFHGILICLSGPGKLPAGVTRVAYGGHRCNMEDIADSKNCNLQFFEKTQKENKNQG
jgi:hypothetical protein